MTKVSLILLLTFTWTGVFGQSIESDTISEFKYEMCVYKEEKPGHILKNEQIGIADTTVANIHGQVYSNLEPDPSAFAIFSNSEGLMLIANTDFEGNYKISLKSGWYNIKFYSLGFNEFSIDQLILDKGQIQEIVVDLGTSGGYYTHVVTFKKKPTEEELKAREKELTDN